MATSYILTVIVLHTSCSTWAGGLSYFTPFLLTVSSVLVQEPFQKARQEMCSEGNIKVWEMLEGGDRSRVVWKNNCLYSLFIAESYANCFA